MAWKNTPEQGDIWLFDPDPAKGNEIKKMRPALIISCNELNEGASGLVIIIPITSKDKQIFSHIRIDPPEGGLSAPSFAVCEQIRSVSKERLIKKLGKIKDRATLQAIHSWITDLIWLA